MALAGALHAGGRRWLLRDTTRPPEKAPLPAETVQRVIDLALRPPPGEATHWTGRVLAKAADVSLRLLQRILEAHQLAPHRIRTFKLYVRFADELRDIVGLYVDAPAQFLNGMVSSITPEIDGAAPLAGEDNQEVTNQRSTSRSGLPAFPSERRADLLVCGGF